MHAVFGGQITTEMTCDRPVQRFGEVRELDDTVRVDRGADLLHSAKLPLCVFPSRPGR